MTTSRLDVPVAIRASKNLEGTVLSVNYRSWQRSFPELPKTCQQWELTFLSNVAFWAAKIPTTFRAEFPVAFRATLSLELTFPTWLQLRTIKVFRAASKFKRYFQFTLLILKFSCNWSYWELHQGLLKTPGLRSFRTSVAKLRCPLLWNIFW